MSHRPGTVLAVVAVALALAAAALAVGKAPAPAVPKPGTPSAGNATAADAATHLVRVYYFRTTNRCVSCKKIEAYTDEAVKGAFVREIEGGKMTWEVINIQEPGNEHFIRDYGLFAKSVVVVDTVGDREVRWKNLAKVWELLDDRPGFVRYVQDEVRQYLEGRS